MKLFSAITEVLGDEISAKGKAIGKLIAKKMPILESKAFKQFKKFKAFFEIIPFQKFLENMREKTILEFETKYDSEIKENEAFLIFRDTELLKEGAWIHYYVIAGVIEYHLNEVFFQGIDVNVDSINEHECIIKFEKRRA